MAEFNLDFGLDEAAGLQTKKPLPGAVISQGPDKSFFSKAAGLLPNNLEEGLFGSTRATGGTATRYGGVSEFFFGGIRDAFSPGRVYSERRKTLLNDGFDDTAASDFAFRITTGQSLDGLDEETKKQMRNSGIVDKGFAALDVTGIGIGKGIGIGVGFMAKLPLKSAAGAVTNTLFGNIAKKGKKAAEVADEVFDAKAAVKETKVPTPSPKDPGKKALDDMADMFNDAQPGLKDKIVEAGEKTSKAYTKMRTEWSDRFTPINNLKTMVEKNIGSKLKLDVDPYVAARLYQGVNGKIQNTLDLFGTHVKKVGKFNTQGQKNLSMYITAKRMAERSARGIENPRGITGEQADGAAKLLETPAIREATAGIKQITDDLLKQAHDSGIISKEGYAAVVSKNQNYVPFDVLEKMSDNIDNVNKAAGGFSVASQDVIKGLKGTDKDIADPLEAIVRKVMKTTTLIERNEVAKKVANLSKLDDTVVTKMEDGAKIAKGNDVFSVYENGQQVKYQTHKDVIAAMKGMNREEVDMVTGVVGAINSVFRKAVTTSNIAFTIPNIFRDVQDAQLIAKHGFGAIDWARGFSDAVNKKGLYTQWREDGGAFSTYVSQATSARMTVKDLTEGTAKKVVKSIINPLRLFETLGSISEEATRLAVYRSAVRKGGDRTFAAMESRQATVDFAKSGNKMRTANLWVPFLNARLQGSLNVVRVSKERPQVLATRAAFLVAGPTVTTYLRNREYDAYSDIPQWEKDSNFIIMNEGDGDGYYTNASGDKIPTYIKIPKGHIGRMVANPIENLMVMQDSDSARAWDDLALQMASDFSPVSFEKEGKVSAPAVLNSVLPPPLKVPVEVHFANKDFFTGQDIVPQSREKASSEFQFKDSTSEFAKDIGASKIGKALDLSPAGIDQYIKGFLGSLGSDGVKMFDAIRGEGPLHSPDATTQDKLKHIPVLNRFIGNRGGEVAGQEFSILEDLETTGVDRSIAETETARQIYDSIRVAEPDGVSDILKDYEEQGSITPGVDRKLRALMKTNSLNLSGVDKKLKSLPTTERASYIFSRMKETEPDDMAAMLKAFEEKGILTEMVEDKIRELMVSQ